jgi:hypothetical protein
MEIPLQARRSLVLLSKVLQALASQVAFGEKEGYMLGLNKFLEENQQNVCQLLDKFSTNTVRSASFRSFVPSEEDKQRAFTSVMNILIGRRAQVREALAKEQQVRLISSSPFLSSSTPLPPLPPPLPPVSLLPLPLLPPLPSAVISFSFHLSRKRFLNQLYKW